MAKSTFSRADAAAAIDKLSAASYKIYDSHSYSSGALGSMLADAIVKMSAKDRKFALDVLESLTAQKLAEGK